MGEVIAFMPPKGGKRSTPAPARAGMILFFTGVRREPMRDPAAPSKRPRRSGGKQAGKPRARSGADCVNGAKFI
jgi:hypothetical protein